MAELKPCPFCGDEYVQAEIYFPLSEFRIYCTGGERCDIETFDDLWTIREQIAEAPTVDAVVLPCEVGKTVYGQFGHYGKKIHECKVVKSKLCQFRDRTIHYFLDVEFNIIDPYYRDGRLMRCMHQAVFGEDFGSWDRVYLTRQEAEAALGKMVGDG